MGSMSLTQFLFSFEGRISRSAYWLKWMLPYIVVMMVLGFLMSMFAIPADPYATPAQSQGAMSGIVGIVFSLVYLASLWPSLAVLAKRWHDRDKSGWWTLIGLVPAIGGFWILIECGFLKGSDGPNRFGDDPLQAGGVSHQPAMEPQA